MSRFAVLAGIGALVVTAACGGSKGTTDATPAPKDVVAACTMRAAWTRATSSSCLGCQTVVTNAPCECDPKEGACIHEYIARVAETECTVHVTDCAHACGTDCACVDACYANAAACRGVA